MLLKQLQSGLTSGVNMGRMVDMGRMVAARYPPPSPRIVSNTANRTITNNTITNRTIANSNITS